MAFLVEKFTGQGFFVVPYGVTSLEFVLVGSGGGGGLLGGGGSAGEVLHETSMAVSAGQSIPYRISQAGGIGSTSTSRRGQDGKKSTFGPYSALQGMGGGSNSTSVRPGQAGVYGSGAGSSSTGTTAGGIGSSGFNGGMSQNGADYLCGGGAGAGGSGTDGPPTGGTGGPGVDLSAIFGFAGHTGQVGGGGGGARDTVGTPAAGGLYGGGIGCERDNAVGGDALAETGGGGGGGGFYSAKGGAGGSGVLLISYEDFGPDPFPPPAPDRSPPPYVPAPRSYILAMPKMAGHFSVPPGVTSIDILLIGGGGSGGVYIGGGGGGAGQVTEVLGITVVPGQGFPYVVGVGGQTRLLPATKTTFGAREALPGGYGGDGALALTDGGNGYNGGGAGSSSNNSAIDGDVGSSALGGANAGFASPSGSGVTVRSGGGGAGTWGDGGEGTVALGGGVGGEGLTIAGRWGEAFGELGWVAAGGGGSSESNMPFGLGGHGGGGSGDGGHAMAKTGSGGGGNGGCGADGLILVKFTDTTEFHDPRNLSKQSFLEVLFSGGATNSDPDACLGGAISFFHPRAYRRTEVIADLTEAERLVGRTSYRCLYLENTHPTESMANLTLWIDIAPLNSGTTLTVGVDPVGLNGVATTIGDETTAPSGVTFSAPASYGTGINLGTLVPGDFVAFWFKREVSAGAPATSQDRLLFGLQFDD